MNSMKLLTPVLALIATCLAMSAVAAPTVVVAEVEEGLPASSVVVNGLVRARHDIRLPARTSGELLWVLEEGTVVEQGTEIARIDDALLVLEHAEQEIVIDRARSLVSYLEGEVARLLELEKNNLAARTQLAEMQSRRDIAEGDLRVAEARLRRIDENIVRTRVIAPVRGMVTRRFLMPGEYTREGDAVARLVNPEELEVIAAVPVVNMNQVDLNVNGVIRSHDVEVNAPIRHALKSGDESSQTFNVILDLGIDAAARLVSGQFVDVELPVTRYSAVFVPRDAVVLRAEGNFVFMIDDSNTAKKVDVVLGEGTGSMVSVEAGEQLKTGDRVAVRGAERLQDGQEVTPVTS